MEKTTIKFKKKTEGVIPPSRANAEDTGYLVHANEDVSIVPLGIEKINTGLFFDIPEGYELQIRGTGKLALLEGFTVAEGIGSIGPGFKSELSIQIKNLKPYSKTIRKGEIIGEIVLNKLPTVSFEETVEFEEIKTKTDTTVVSAKETNKNK